MSEPSINAACRMFCRQCGYALIGLPSNRCPECGREFDPGNPKTFRTRPPRVILRRIVKIVVTLFILSLPADGYFGYLDWRFNQEKPAIQFLRSHGVAIALQDTRPHWVKVLLGDRAAWLWERADDVNFFMFAFDRKRANVPQYLAAVGKLKSLRSLDLRSVHLTDNDLVNLRGLTELQKLTVWEPKVTDAGLVNLKGLIELKELSLAKTKITDAGLVNLSGLANLQGLDLDETKVTDAGLVNLKGLTALQWLTLSHTKVTGAGLVHLKGLAKLRDLFLGDTNVTDAGLVNLKGLTALQELELYDTQVTHAGLVNLKGLTGLQSLNLFGTQVTAADVADLQSALPKCKISWNSKK